MSVRKGISRAAVRKERIPADQILALDCADGWPGADSVSMSRDRAMKISTVNRCVEVLSTSMAVLPTYIMDERTHQRLPDHRLGPVLWERPNEDMTAFDFNRLMMSEQLLRGNAVAWTIRDPRTGYVTERLPLPYEQVTVYVDLAGVVWYFYTCPRTGETWRLHQADVTHYKAWSKDGIEGVPVLQRAAQTMATAEAAEKYQTAIYQSGGRPSGVLTTETDLNGYVDVRDSTGNVTQVSKKERIRKEWEKFHRGADNAMRTAVLDLGLKYQPIAMSNSDAQFVESSEIRVADVCRFFGVPLHLAYAGKQSYNSNEQNGIEYVNYTLLGYDTQWAQEDTYKLLLPSERRNHLRVKRELKVFLRGDTAAQASWYKAMREVGAYNADEIRALEDMGQIPGGGGHYASLNYVPLSAWEELSRRRAGTSGGGRQRKELLEALLAMEE